MHEKVLTVGLHRPQVSAQQFRKSLEELGRLIETAGGTVVREISQSKPHPEPATFIGKGKALEINQEIKDWGVNTVIFDDDLAPTQQKNLEKLISAKIIDRTRLILDIFAKRAHTKEGQLQVELAQLNYLVPRLTGAWRGFSQQLGGIGTRGPGERKIEVERRYVRERIKRLKKEIGNIRKHRERIRVNRERVPLPQVALVGYTNVGKSTLLNTLVKDSEAVYADDKLFATLDPTTRRVKLPHGRIVLCTDTVGFIQKLPHSLVAAFHATLEEISRAQLLVHLIDSSAEDRDNQVQTVLNVVRDLKADHLPMISVFNKADLLSKNQLEGLMEKGNLCVSGKTREGIPELLERIERKLDETLLEVTFNLPHAKRKLLNNIYQTGYVLKEEPLETGTSFTIRIDRKNWSRINRELQLNEIP